MIRPANIPQKAVETGTLHIVRESAKLTLAIGYPVRLVGRPGTGKSCALWHVAEEMRGSFCEITGTNKNTKGMLEAVLDSIGMRSGKNHLSDIADLAYNLLAPKQEFCVETGDWKQIRRLLVVDEVQTLEATAFRELLRLQEKCSLGLVLAGNEERLAGGGKDAATWEQIESRILPPRQLPGPSEKDCIQIGLTFNVEGNEAYALIAKFGTATNFRALVQLLEVAKRLTGGAVGIRQQHLQSALKFMKPRPEVLKLLKPETA